MKYAFIRAHREEFGVRAMCRVLRVHFSGFSAWLKEPLSHRAQEDARQTELIRQAWADSGKVYGYRKLTDDLRDPVVVNVAFGVFLWIGHYPIEQVQSALFRIIER